MSSTPTINRSINRSINRIGTASVALLVIAFVCKFGVAQEPSAAHDDAKKPKSRYPVVVEERDVNFSIPDAATKPAVTTKRVTAQPFLPKEIYQRTAEPILEATDLISDGFDRSVVEIIHGQDQVALGTVIGLNAQILTKYSLISDIPEGKLRFRANGISWSGSLVGFDEENDLAILELHSGEKPPENTLRPVAFTTDGKLRNGRLVIGVGVSSKSLAVGMTTAPPIQARKTDCETCIDMGLSLDVGMNLTRVYPRTVGERLGMLVGDRILMINQQRVFTPVQFEKIEKQIQFGDVVTLTYLRNGQAFVITDKVPSITKNSKQDRWGGGPFSQRRTGFNDVLVHDSVIEPRDCGGPLVNLQGEFCGINIARSMRVCSLAIPARSVQEFVLKHVDKTELIIERQVRSDDDRR